MMEEEKKKKENEEGEEFGEVIGVMDIEEMIRLRHRLRKAGKERGWWRMDEEIRKREVEEG